MLTERAPHLLNVVSENLNFLNGRSVGIDIDAVTQATYILALRNVSRAFGKVVLKEEIKTYWGLVDIVEKNGVSKDRSLDYAKEAWNNNEVYSKSPEMPGIRALLEVFNEIKVPYKFFSARPPGFKSVTKSFFKEKFPWVPNKNIILGRKEGVSGGLFKALMIKKHNVGLFIEDAPEEAEEIVKYAQIPVLIVPQPWNAQENITHPMIRLLGKYSERDGTWPVLRFLAGKDAKSFFDSVAQS